MQEYTPREIDIYMQGVKDARRKVIAQKGCKQASNKLTRWLQDLNLMREAARAKGKAV